MVKKTFNILSLDGGGYKGLFTISLLKELESKFSKKCFDVFDLFAGTSTGSIIALALAMNKSTDDIKKAYLSIGPKVFTSKKMPLFRAIYDNKKLNKELSLLYGDTTLNDVHKFGKKALIPAVNLSNRTTKIFKTDHAERLNQHNNYKLSDIATASSSAPIYFDSFKLKRPTEDVYEYFADGGLFANNPTCCAIIEAVHFLQIPIENIRVFSIGTEAVTKTLGGENGIRKGIESWTPSLIEISLSTTSQIHQFLSSLMLNGRNEHNRYYRVEPSENNLKIDSIKGNANEILINNGIDLANSICNESLIKELFEIQEDYIG